MSYGQISAPGWPGLSSTIEPLKAKGVLRQEHARNTLVHIRDHPFQCSGDTAAESGGREISKETAEKTGWLLR